MLQGVPGSGANLSSVAVQRWHHSGETATFAPVDPVTHAFVGAVIGYTVRGRELGRHAAGLGALAGIAPDIDNFVSSDVDPLLYVEYHRFFTHSLLFSFIGAFLPMLPWLARRSFREHWRTLWVCAWPAYLSHCLLDATTTWGTQLLWPFARTRVSWDLIAIIDPVFTLTIGVALAFALIRRSRSAAVAGLVFALVYLGVGAAQHARASDIQRRLAAERGHHLERAQVMPTLANNIVWRSLYLADGRIYSDRIRVGWFSAGLARAGTSLPLMTAADLQPEEDRGNKVHRSFDRFAWFSDGWVARAPADETIIGDMRYSRSAEAFDPIWGIRFTNVNGRATVEWVSRERQRRLNVGQLWNEVSGADARYRVVR